MKKRLHYFVLALITLSLISCIDDTPCSFDGMSSITSVNGPSEVPLGQTIEFIVFHEPEFGCTTDRGFDVFMQGNIVFINQLIRTQCKCSSDPEIMSSNFRFTPLVAGTYTFRFRTNEDTTIIRNVVVE